MRISTFSDFVAAGHGSVSVRPSNHVSVNLHQHDFYEMVYAREGFCLHEVDGQMALFMEGDWVLMRPGASHRYIGSRTMRIYNCLFRVEALEGALEALRQMGPIAALFEEDGPTRHICFHLDLAERKAVSRMLNAMVEEEESGQLGWETRLSAMLKCLLVDFARVCAARQSDNASDGEYTGYVQRAMACIETRYADTTLTVRDIAAEVGVSGDYLSRQFRHLTGVPAQEYLRRYRFARAMELLQSDRSIGEICHEVGFGNLCHFSREFKKEMGMTPSQYRKHNQEGG